MAIGGSNTCNIHQLQPCTGPRFHRKPNGSSQCHPRAPFGVRSRESRTAGPLPLYAGSAKTATAALQGKIPTPSPPDHGFNQKGLNLREEQRWQREEQRWAREKHRHGNEAGKWKVTEEKLKRELAELQAKLAERRKRATVVPQVVEECTEPAAQDRDLLTPLGVEASTAQREQMGRKGDVGKVLGDKTTNVRSHVPPLTKKGHAGSGNKGAGTVNNAFNLKPKTLQTYAMGDSNMADGTAAESGRHTYSTQPSQGIIDVDNLINRDNLVELTAPGVLMPQDFPSGLSPLSAGVSTVGGSINQPDTSQRSLKRQPELRHFNEHAYVHNYLRHHHAQWWWRTHGPGRGAADESPLLSAKRLTISEAREVVPPSAEGES